MIIHFFLTIIMGILRLFRYLINTYQNNGVNRLTQQTQQAFFRAIDQNQPFQVDMLLIDLNAIFHPCAREVFYPEETGNRNLVRPRRMPAYEVLELQAFQKVVVYVEQLIKICPVRKVLYLAIDGVAGMCKQTQQRKRRYKNAQTRDIAGFDTCHITAGTPWMARLCKFIASWVVEKKATTFANIQVIYSDMYVAGEGEHKLIRYLDQSCKPHNSYCVFSPDADLIMLCMGLSKGKGYILRENIYDDVVGKYLLVNCDALKSNITSSLIWPTHNNSASLQCSSNTNRIIRDYVMFLMLVGNDFLPNLYCLEIGNEGIDILNQCYITAANSHGHLVNEVNLIKQDSFVALFEALANQEQSLLMKKYFKGSRFPDVLLQKHVVNKPVEPNSVTMIKTLEFDNLRKEYYQTKFALQFPADITPEDFTAQVQLICEAYIRGLNFVLTYYAVTIPTFDWFFEYHYAPLMCDIFQTAKDMPLREWNQLQEWKFIPPLTLNQSLIGVIPPSSVDVLPPSIQPLLRKNAQHPLFIEEFKVDLDGKQQDYEAVCLLPNVNYNVLKALCKDNSKHQEPTTF